MFSYQMKFIAFHPVGPASAFNLSLLNAHELVSLPCDSGLGTAMEERVCDYAVVVRFTLFICI